MGGANGSTCHERGASPHQAGASGPRRVPANATHPSSPSSTTPMLNHGAYAAATSTAWSPRMPESTMRPPSAHARGKRGREQRSADWRGCWRRRRRTCCGAERVRRAGTNEAVTRLARALARARLDRLRIDVDADDASRAKLGRRDREDAGAATVVEHRLARRRARTRATRGTVASSDASRCRTRAPDRASG